MCRQTQCIVFTSRGQCKSVWVPFPLTQRILLIESTKQLCTRSARICQKIHEMSMLRFHIHMHLIKIQGASLFKCNELAINGWFWRSLVLFTGSAALGESCCTRICSAAGKQSAGTACRRCVAKQIEIPDKIQCSSLVIEVKRCRFAFNFILKVICHFFQ